MLTKKVDSDARKSMPLVGNALENFDVDNNSSTVRSPIITLGSGGLFNPQSAPRMDINDDVESLKGDVGRSKRSLFSPRNTKFNGEVIKSYLAKINQDVVKDKQSNEATTPK